MSDIEVTSVCEEGYAVESDIGGEWQLVVDALGEEGPTAQQVLVADYASCYVPAFRVAADQEGHGDVGRIEVETEADLDEDDDVESIEFRLQVEASLDGNGQTVADVAEDICHVHSSLVEENHADVTVEEEAF